MRHYFEFDGVKSSDYGVFISGAQTMGAAGRDVDEIVVPGMDGNLTIDNGRFNAVAHTYPAFIAEDAKEGLKSLRNALLSKRGHKRLSDTVHPDEFYRAYYEHGLEPELTANLRHSELEIEFTRDPRRFLVSGDTPEDISGASETFTGSPATFDYTGGSSLSGISVVIPIVQEGSGDPSPLNVRSFTGWTGLNVITAGKNLWDNAKFALCNFTLQDTGYYRGTLVNLAALNCGYYVFEKQMPLGRITISFDKLSSSSLRVYLHYTDSDTWQNKSGNITAAGHFHYTSDSGRICDGIQFGTTAGSTAVVSLKNVQITKSTEELTYEEYAGDTLPVTWSDHGAVYGGTVDLLLGKLTVTHEIVDLGTLTYASNGTDCVSADVPLKAVGSQDALSSELVRTAADTSADDMPDNSFMCFSASSSIAVKKSGITAGNAAQTLNGVKLVYELADPVEYDITPEEITALTGENNIWSNGGDVTVTLTDPAVLVNPTLFASSPLIRVYGQGTISIGNTAITVGGSFPYVDIDTEIADCSYEGQNANQYVTFSGLDFPKLEPGENYITFTGFTAVEVTPRWWRL